MSWSPVSPLKAVVAAVAVPFFFLSCAREPAGPPQIASVVVVGPATLTVNQSATFTVEVLDDKGGVMSGQDIAWSSGNEAVATVSSAGMVAALSVGPVRITASASGKSGFANVTITAIPVSTVTIAGAGNVVVRALSPFTATMRDASGASLAGRTVTWSSSDATVAQIDATGSVIALSAGTTQISATSEGKTGSVPLLVQQGALPIRGLYAQFERRGWPSGYFSGHVIKHFTTHDSVVGSTVAVEIGKQLDEIKLAGVNAITFELRSADATFDPSLEPPPNCNVSMDLGLLWPEPTAVELANLVLFFDLVHSKGLKVLLRLVNTHMEEASRSSSQVWLGSILSSVKSHPALELVLFEGDEELVDKDGNGSKESCGGRAEPPLWFGIQGAGAKYIKFAFGVAQGLGIPARKLSAQATVGGFYMDNQGGAGPAATDGHLWYTPSVMKTVFDDLGIPDSERTYALSFYQQRRCRLANGMTCTEGAPHDWAEETIRRVFAAIGIRARARVIAVEFGITDPMEAGWTSEQALQSAVGLMRKYGVDGGSFWRWVNNSNAEDATATTGNALKRRGAGFTYTPAREVMRLLYSVP